MHSHELKGFGIEDLLYIPRVQLSPLHSSVQLQTLGLEQVPLLAHSKSHRAGMNDVEVKHELILPPSFFTLCAAVSCPSWVAGTLSGLCTVSVIAGKVAYCCVEYGYPCASLYASIYLVGNDPPPIHWPMCTAMGQCSSLHSSSPDHIQL